MPANPCSGIKVEDSPSEEPVRVLSIAEIKHLLELAQMELQATLKVGKTKMSVIKVYPGELVPWFVLGLFAGLRPEETVRLDWADIDFDRRQIDLPAKKAKGRTRRIIPMEPNLIEWLKPYRPVGGNGKAVSNFRWHFQVYRAAKGDFVDAPVLIKGSGVGQPVERSKCGEACQRGEIAADLLKSLLSAWRACDIQDLNWVLRQPSLSL